MNTWFMVGFGLIILGGSDALIVSGHSLTPSWLSAALCLVTGFVMMVWTVPKDV